MTGKQAAILKPDTSKIENWNTDYVHGDSIHTPKKKPQVAWRLTRQIQFQLKTNEESARNGVRVMLWIMFIDGEIHQEKQAE